MKIRELQGDDIYRVSEILDAIGFEGSSINSKGKDKSQIGMEFLINIFKKLHKAKKEVNALLSDLTGLKVEEIGKLKIKEYKDLIMQLKDAEGITDLFK